MVMEECTLGGRGGMLGLCLHLLAICMLHGLVLISVCSCTSVSQYTREVRGQLVGAGSLLLPYGSQDSISNWQAWPQTFSLAGPSPLSPPNHMTSMPKAHEIENYPVPTTDGHSSFGPCGLHRFFLREDRQSVFHEASPSVPVGPGDYGCWSSSVRVSHGYPPSPCGPQPFGAQRMMGNRPTCPASPLSMTSLAEASRGFNGLRTPKVNRCDLGQILITSMYHSVRYWKILVT